MVTIRKAKAEDAEAIAQIHVSSWQTTYQGIVDREYLTSLKWEERVDRWKSLADQKDQAYFVALVEEQIVGFSGGGRIRHPTGHYDCELYVIYILKEFHGQHIGTQLFLSLVEWLQESGYRSLIVWIAHKNMFKNFYTALGGKLTTYSTKATIGGSELQLVSYGWDQIGDLKNQLGE